MPSSKTNVNSLKSNASQGKKSKSSIYQTINPKKKHNVRDLSPESKELLKLVPDANRRTMTRPSDDDSSDSQDDRTSVAQDNRASDQKKSGGRSSRKTKKVQDDDSDEETPSGEYEVERIVDIATDRDDRILFRCRWAGFNAGDDTWETKHHFTHANALFRGFCDAQRKLLHGSIATGLLEHAIKAINNCLTKKKPDACLLFRLIGLNVNENTTSFNVSLSSQQKRLKTITKSKEFLPHMSDGILKINHKNYPSDLDGLIDIAGLLGIPPWDLYDVALLYQSRRASKTHVSLKEYGRKLTEKMSQMKRSSKDIIVENLLDSFVPEDFEYIVEYDLNGNLKAKPADEFLKCFCGDVCEKSCFCNTDNEKNPPFRLLKDTPTLRCGSRQPVYLCTKLCDCKCLVKDINDLPQIPFTIFRTKNRGWGLRARAEIKKGQMVTTYLGQLLNEQQRIQRQKDSPDESYVTYLFDLDFHSDTPVYSIDAKHKGNEARFINHSCRPNLSINPIYSDYRDPECPVLGFFANDTIEAGQELTIDYNAISLDDYVIPPHMTQLKKKMERKRAAAAKNRRRSKAPLTDSEVEASSSKKFKSCEDEDDSDDPEADLSQSKEENEDIDNFTQLNPCQCRKSNCRGFIF